MHPKPLFQEFIIPSREIILATHLVLRRIKVASICHFSLTCNETLESNAKDSFCPIVSKHHSTGGNRNQNLIELQQLSVRWRNLALKLFNREDNNPKLGV